MTYDANGIRMSKLRVNHIDIVDSSYIYDSNGRLRTETEGAYTRRYLYSSDGIVGYEENGERYFYRKNLFGDITAIYQGATKACGIRLRRLGQLYCNIRHERHWRAQSDAI